MLELLCCAACSAAVAPRDADRVPCPYCGAAVEVPDAYRELARFGREDRGAHATAERLLGRLDTPPWLLTRILAAVLDQPTFAFFMVYGVPVFFAALVVTFRIGNRIARSMGKASIEELSFAVPVSILVGSLLLLAFVPRALGIHASRRQSARAALLGALSAGRPRQPGGPATCRECAAPLDVPDGATVVRCLYCHTDNAVRLRTPFLQATGAAVRAKLKTIADAAATDIRERRQHRLALLRALGSYVLWFGLFGALFAVFAIDTERPEVKAGREEPTLGIVSVIAAGLLLIFVLIRGGADEDAEARRRAWGVPGWVRIVGPLGVWAMLAITWWLIASVG